METTSTTERLNDISGTLESVRGAAHSLACKASEQNGKASEAWTLHAALRAVEQDVQDLRSDLEG